MRKVENGEAFSTRYVQATSLLPSFSDEVMSGLLQSCQRLSKILRLDQYVIRIEGAHRENANGSHGKRIKKRRQNPCLIKGKRPLHLHRTPTAVHSG